MVDDKVKNRDSLKAMPLDSPLRIAAASQEEEGAKKRASSAIIANTVTCPECGALAGMPCEGISARFLEGPHEERIFAWAATAKSFRLKEFFQIMMIVCVILMLFRIAPLFFSLLGAFSAIGALICWWIELGRMKPAEQKIALNRVAGYTHSPNFICPHCHNTGSVWTKRESQKKGVSGGKATAAVLTGGVSLLAVGLSRKENATSANCTNCDTTWNL